MEGGGPGLVGERSTEGVGRSELLVAVAAPLYPVLINGRATGRHQQNFRTTLGLEGNT